MNKYKVGVSMDLEDLKKKKISDLRYIGKMLGIKSMTKMTKQELIEAILDSEQKAAESKEETAEPAAELEQEQEQERPAPTKSRRGRKSGTSKRQKKNETSEGTTPKTEENAEQEEKKMKPNPRIIRKRRKDFWKFYRKAMGSSALENICRAARTFTSRQR